MGTLILLGSVIVMTLLASIDSGISSDLKSYSTEYRSLVVYDTFLVSSSKKTKSLASEKCAVEATSLLMVVDIELTLHMPLPCSSNSNQLSSIKLFIM